MKHMYFKQFLQRGMAFGGFGPIIAGIIYWILSFSLPAFSLTGGQVCMAILSTYVLAFVQAGASVFNQIEHWSPAKSLLCHFATVYAAYTGCYLINRWIPIDPMIVVIFTVIFAASYLAIWLTVYSCIKAISRRCNAQLNR